MHSKNAGSPFIATIVLLFVGIVLAGAVWMWDTVDSSEEPIVERAYKLEFISARIIYPVSVGNAGWQIEIIVRNNGDVEDTVDKIHVSKELVNEMGLSPSDSLSNSSSMGTDIPVDGLVIPAGQSVYLHVWVGADLFSRGTQVSVELQRPNQIELKKYVTLS